MAIINITPNSSGEGLRQKLDDEAQKHGVTLRTLVANVYSYAVKHRDEFTGPLREARKTPGEHIGATVDDDVAKKLTAWAKEKRTPRGVHCKYLLEKALEQKILSKVT